MLYDHVSRKYFLLLALFSNSLMGQVTGIAINDDNAAADVSAILDINLNTATAKKGLLIPRITTTQRNAITTPAAGLFVFNTTTGWFEYNAGTAAVPNWQPLLSSLTGWRTTGNSGTVAGTNFIGTTDNAGLLFKVNNTNAGFIDNSGVSNNLYLGLNAGNYGTTTATGNIALGAGALAANTGGNSNTAVGYQALSTNTSGTNNTAVGYTASVTTSTATASTVVGYNAKTNSSNALAMGANTQANNTQATAIGNAAQANGANATAIGNGANTSQDNALVLGNANTNVGIGTSTPNTTAKLDVNGGFKLGTAGTVLTNIYKTSVSVNIPAVSLLNTSSVTVAVANAPLNSTVTVNPRSALPGGLVMGYAYVSSANNITITFGALISLAIGVTRTFDITILY